MRKEISNVGDASFIGAVSSATILKGASLPKFLTITIQRTLSEVEKATMDNDVKWFEEQGTEVKIKEVFANPFILDWHENISITKKPSNK